MFEIDFVWKMFRGLKLSSSLIRKAPVVQSRALSEQPATAAAGVRKSYKKMANRPVVVEQRARNAELEAKAQAANKDWRIVGAT